MGRINQPADASDMIRDVLRRLTALEAAAQTRPAQTSAGTAFTIVDSLGDTLVSADSASGQGLARPYLEIALGRADTANWPTTTSASFVDMFFGLPAHQHPKIYFQGKCLVPTSTNAAIQLISGSTVIGAPVAITGSTGVQQVWSIGPVVWGGTHAAFTDLRVQARVTSGAGSIALMVGTAVGQQT